MKIEQLHLIEDEIHKHHDLSQYVSESKMYYIFHDEWFDSSSVKIQDQELIEKLQQTLVKGSPWRRKVSNLVFYFLKKYNAVAILTFRTIPRRKTLDRVNKHIDECIKRAEDNYNATHDAMTELINARKFEEKFETLLETTRITGVVAHSDEIQTNFVAALMMIDIDYFKQVNDSVGHDYGDIILKIFSQRLENKLIELSKKMPEIKEIFLGRCGGEEFKVGICGVLSNQNLQELGNNIRCNICESALPNDDEWKNLPDDITKSISLPENKDRNITISVGISSIIALKGSETTRSHVKNLVKEADVALYKAKASGRNVVRYFPEIKEKYGCVLEHHGETNIVTIDIGANMQVNKGDEFLVYHPDFTGNKPFTFSDGRTRKKLGSYPREPCGRIQVTHVQNEISFCAIIDNKLKGLFPVNSVLEFIPIGSITYLLKDQSDILIGDMPMLEKPSTLTSFISDMGKKGVNPKVGVLFICNQNEIQQSRGSSYVNYILVLIFKSLRDVFTTNSKISQVQINSFAVAIENLSNRSMIKKLTKVINNVQEKTIGIAKIGVGLFDMENVEKLPGDESKLSGKNALDYALYAANAHDGSLPIQFFSVHSTAIVLYQLRKDMRYKQILTEVERMRQLGIHYCLTENQSTLAAFEMADPKLDIAQISALEAVRLNPSDNILWANLAIVEAALHKWIESAEHFYKADTLGKKDFGLAYKLPRAWAYWLYFRHKGILFQSLLVMQKELKDIAQNGIDPRYKLTNDELIQTAEYIDMINSCPNPPEHS